MTSSADQTIAPPPASFPAGAAARGHARPAAERLSRLDKIQTATVFYIGVWALSPPLFVNNWARVAAVVAVSLWLFCEITRRNGIIFRPGAAVLIALFYAGYTTLTILSADGPSALVMNIQMFIFVLFFVQFQAAIRHGLAKYRWVLWISLGLLALWMAITVGALRGNDHIAREIVRSTDATQEYAATGIGGYGLVYAALWAIPALFYLVANLPPLPARRYGDAARRWAIARRALAVISLLLAVVLVMTAGYSIATLSFFLAVLAYLLLRGRGQGRAMRIILASAVAIVAVGLLQTDLLGNMIEQVKPLTEGTNYYRKLDDMQMSLNSESAVGTVHDRTDRYMRSAQLFVENPLMGVRSARDIGKHSLVLDTFARFGIIGGLPLLFILFSVPIRIMRASTKRPAMAGVAFASLVLVAVCTFSNDISAAMGFVIYLIYPLAMTYWRPPRPGRRPAVRFRPA
jgi:O-antigen ligase